ncbi:cysteine hydrolase [Undibacterium sp. Di27W]|uniref:cysteine hydrolase n=1 Tax=Undibacterium sp. Di27W TaxID=3413036 RepID=UPI003BF11FA3
MTAQLKDTFDKDRSAFVFIEFQSEWLDESGVLFEKLVQDKPAFRNAVTQAALVLKAAREHDGRIAHAGLDLRDDPGYQLFGKGKQVLGLRSAIPKAQTWTGTGAEFVAPFIPEQGEFIMHGRSGASVLKNSSLDPYLRNNRIDTIFLMGFATHVCVESTLREAHDLGLNVYVVSDACAAFTRAQDEYFHEHILHHFGGGTDAAELVRLLKA